jgi:hypothetical protein
MTGRTMSIKLRLKAGDVELEYEGDEAFIKDELRALLESVAGVSASTHAIATSSKQSSADGAAASATTGVNTASAFPGTVKNMYLKLGGKQQQDLVVAAAAFLTLIESKSEFYRRDLLDAMKTAVGYFKTNHSKNLSSILDTLMKEGKLHALAKDRYSLEGNFLEEIRRTLGISR